MDERICLSCGITFTPKTRSRAGRFCSLPCYYDFGPRGPRKDKIKGQRMVSLPNHPLAPPSGIIARSRVSLYDEIGPGPHACHWCKAIVNWETGLVPGALIVDHLDWNIENNLPENLVPSCLNCNSHRRQTGEAKLIKDDELTVLRNGKPTRAIEKRCIRCETPFLITPAEVRAGKGRYCSRECMYLRNQPIPPDLSGG